MAVRYALYKNHFKKEEEYMARVVPAGLCTHEDLLEIMSQRHAGVSTSEVLAVLEEYMLAIEFALRKGMSVFTPLLKIQTSIQGRFAHEQERFHPKRHRLKINLSAGSRLKACADSLQVKKVAPSHPMPVLHGCKDFLSGTTNELLSPGGLAGIEGENLRFDTEHAGHGIFLSGTGKKIQVRQVVHNKPIQLFFMLPEDLPQGIYQLSVKATVGNSTEVRMGMLGTALQVK